MLAALFLPVLIIAAIGIIRLGGHLLKSPGSQRPLSGKAAALQKSLRVAGVCILAAGLVAAGIVYHHAPAEDDGGAIGYEIDGGTASPVQAGDVKSYGQQMEGLGGSISVLAAEIGNWFRGRKLAYALAFLAISGSLGCFIFAHLQAYAPPAEDR